MRSVMCVGMLTLALGLAGCQPSRGHTHPLVTIYPVWDGLPGSNVYRAAPPGADAGSAL